MQLIPADNLDEWRRALGEVEAYDFYHLPEYHQLAQQRGEGEAFLFCFRESGRTIVLPFLLRSLAGIEGLEDEGRGLSDISSVYGYCGPVASPGAVPEAIASAFANSLKSELHRLRVVSLFSRLHPLLVQEPLVAALGWLERQGQTVSIDLAASDEEQFASYRSSHRYEVRKLRAADFEVTRTKDPSALAAFVEMYQANMTRVGASSGYFFDMGYFESLLKLDCMNLFICRKDDEIAAGAIFSAVGVISQYHLSATAEPWLRAAPIKLVIDCARQWAKDEGCTALHLGGGLGAGEDALFRFKAGFSDDRHDFRTWRWIVDPDAYSALVEKRLGAAAPADPEASAGAFFPAYRA